MDTIGKVSEGIIEICWDCGHIERLSQFKRDLGISARVPRERRIHAHGASTVGHQSP